MKNLFKSMPLILAAAIIFSACSKDTAGRADTITMKSIASSELGHWGTRTYYDPATDLIYWNTTGEELKVLQVIDGELNPAVPQTTEGYTLSERAATFEVTFPVVEADEYTYSAIYPAVNYVAGDNTDPANFKVECPARQMPTSTSFDRNADLLLADPVTHTTQMTETSFRFYRLVGMGEMTLVGITAGEAIATVEFTAPKILAGRSYVDLVHFAIKETGYEGGNTITLDMQGAIATGTDTIWFTALPCEMGGGETFHVKVTTDKAVYEKTVTLPAGRELNFRSGAISLFGIAGMTRTELKTETFDFPSIFDTVTSNQPVANVKQNGITLAFSKGTGFNVPTYYYLGTGIRIFPKNTITVTGGTITKVEFTYTRQSANGMTANVGDWVAPVWTGESTGPVFTAGGTADHDRISHMVVTYKL